MITFKAVIQKFRDQGEKTGWSYIEIPEKLAQKLKPGNKKAFRVKGQLDKYKFEGISLLPMGEGDFIMALKADIRKAIRKEKGATVEVKMEMDKKEKKLSVLFMECLAEEPQALIFFKTLAKSHQHYFSDWIESAKTDATKANRIAMSVNALAQGYGYSEMIRMNKKKKDER